MRNCGWRPSVVLSGCAPGADRLGEQWAGLHGIPVDPYPAKWRKPDGTKDRDAGFKRNTLMAENADALVAIWDRESSGTRDMIDKAVSLGLRVHIHTFDNTLLPPSAGLANLLNLGYLP